MDRLCQSRLEQVRTTRRLEEILGTRAGEMQDAIDFAGERRGGGLRQNARGQKTIDYNQIDVELLAAQRAGASFFVEN